MKGERADVGTDAGERGAELVKDSGDGPVERFGAVDGDGREPGAGKDEAFGHGLGEGSELLADAGLGAATLADVAVDATGETHRLGSLDEDGEIEEGAELGEVEGEDAFDDEDGSGVGALGTVGDAGVGAEVVGGEVDRAAFDEAVEVLQEEVDLEGVRVVEVACGAFGWRDVAEVAVEAVEGQETGGELGGELAGEGGFAGARAAGDAEDEGPLREEELLRERGGSGGGISHGVGDCDLGNG